ncbi:MAG: ATP-dependent DNA helicase, partial [Anaerolineales bacterium]
LRRFENFYRRGAQNADEARLLAKLLVWLQATETGDRAELNLNNPVDRDIWNSISAEDSGCTIDNCLRRTGGRCPYYRVRMAAQSSHLLIVNHALLLADVSTGSRVLPDYNYLIVDEAHHLEEAITNALSFELTRYDLERLIREIGNQNSSLLGRVMESTSKCFTPVDQASINFLIQKATDLAFRLEFLNQEFFASIDRFFYELREGQEIGMYSHQERIVPAHRSQPGWYNIETSWDEFEKVFLNFLEILQKIQQAIAENIESILELDEDLYSDLANLMHRYNEVLGNIHALVFKPNPEMIYWVEIKNNNGNISLHAAPLHIGPLMKKHIWNEKTSVVLTSATLTTANDFQYIRQRLQAEDAQELAVGSPFDYETSTLLCLASDIPEPADRYAYQREIEKSVIQICKASQGRALVLFTSYDQLRRTSQAITPPLSLEDIIVYEQGEGASAHALLDNFRTSERAVLLGTRAFWEGVDVPGEALSVLIITKLPFDVPTDPIIAARAETFDDPFNQYSLPEAILKFRQGFGRLIRSKQDRGAVVILDKRIQSKRYGKLFLDSLPICTTQVAPLSAIPRAVQKWLNL